MSRQENTDPIVTQVGQIGLNVDDLPIARKFYRETLGLTILMETPTMIFFDLGDIRLMIGTQQEAVQPSAATLIYLKTSSIEEGLTRLQQASTEIVQTPLKAHEDENHELWLCFFKDPAGHTLALMEERLK